MQPDARDAAYLWDMLDAARAVQEFEAPRSLSDYVADRMLRGAVERHLEIVGEAANRVSRGFRAAHPEIPGNPSSRSGTYFPMSTAISRTRWFGGWPPSASRNSSINWKPSSHPSLRSPMRNPLPSPVANLFCNHPDDRLHGAAPACVVNVVQFGRRPSRTSCPCALFT